MRRLLAALLLVLAARGARAADAPPDPLAALLDGYTPPPEGPGRLEALESRVQLAADGLELFARSADDDRRYADLTRRLDPSLAPFFKDKDSSLDALYRTLAVADYERASELAQPSCSPGDKRDALLASADGLFADPRTGNASVWLVKLLGPGAEGRPATEALQSASASQASLAVLDYARLRSRAHLISEALRSPRAVGEVRARLLCKRAQVYESLAATRRAETTGQVLASRALGDGAPPEAASVLLVAERAEKGYRAVGAATIVQEGAVRRALADAGLAGKKDLVAFAKPAEGSVLGKPLPFSIERADKDAGVAVARIEGTKALPALRLSTATPATGELTRAIGHSTVAGSWLVAQGLVTSVSAGRFQTDAAVDAGMAGGAVLNARGDLVGLLVLAGGPRPVAVSGPLLARVLAVKPVSPADDSLAAGGSGGSSTILTAAEPFDAQRLSAGDGAVQAGLPIGAGGVNWEGGGGVGGFHFQKSSGGAGFAGAPPPQAMFAQQMGQVGTQLFVQGLSSLISGLFAPPVVAPPPPRPPPALPPTPPEVTYTEQIRPHPIADNSAKQCPPGTHPVSRGAAAVSGGAAPPDNPAPPHVASPGSDAPSDCAKTSDDCEVRYDTGSDQYSNCLDAVTAGGRYCGPGKSESGSGGSATSGGQAGPPSGTFARGADGSAPQGCVPDGPKLPPDPPETFAKDGDDEEDKEATSGANPGLPGDILTAPETFQGASVEEVEANVPEDWVKDPSSSGDGVRYHPTRSRADQIRVMPGDPDDSNPVKRGPYLRVSFRGKKSPPIPLQGNPTL